MMINKNSDIGLYVIITNPVLSYGKIAEICVNNKIKFLQLREKNISDKELIKAGKEIRSVTRGSLTNFVVNDRLDIAVICEADYLHLGQDDISIEDVRGFASGIRVGLSTHTIEQAVEALEKKPDYIGFGPIFPTTAKAKPDNPVGTEKLKQVLSIAEIPVVAIGGIFPENINSVILTGVRNIAMVRYLMQTEDFEKRIQYIQHIINYKKNEYTN